MAHLRRRTIRIGWVSLALAAVLPATAVASPSPIDRMAQLVSASQSVTSVPSHTVPTLKANLPGVDFSIPSLISHCTPTYLQLNVPSCAYGDTKATATVVLYGNSQAQAWAPALSALGLVDHFRVVPIVKPACGVFLMSDYVDPHHRLSTVCYQFVRHSIAAINALKPSAVIVAATPGVVVAPDAPHAVAQVGATVPPVDQITTPVGRTAASFVGLVRALRPSGAKVVLLGDIPVNYVSGVAWKSPEACLLANPTATDQCALIQPTATNSPWRAAFMAAASAANVPFIDLDSLMCQNGSCPAIVGSVVVKFNQLHVTSAFARLVAPSLGEMIGTDLP